MSIDFLKMQSYMLSKMVHYTQHNHTQHYGHNGAVHLNVILKGANRGQFCKGKQRKNVNTKIMSLYRVFGQHFKMCFSN